MEEAFLSRENRQYLLQTIASQVQVPVDMHRLGAVLENQMGLIRSKMDFRTVSAQKGREVISILNKGVVTATVNSLNRGGQVKSFDDAIKERTRMDQSLGMRKSPGPPQGQMGQPQNNFQQPSRGFPQSQNEFLGSPPDQNAGYSIQQAFSEPVEMKEPELESYHQRMERLMREREIDFKPQEVLPQPPQQPPLPQQGLPQEQTRPQQPPPQQQQQQQQQQTFQPPQQQTFQPPQQQQTFPPPPPPVSQRLVSDMNEVVGKINFHQILIDTETLGVSNEKINDYIFRLNRPLESVTRIQVLHVSLPRLTHSIPSWASLDVLDESSKSIAVPFRPGSYGTAASVRDRCLLKKDIIDFEVDEEGGEPDRLVVHNVGESQTIRIPSTWAWRRLGFHMEQIIPPGGRIAADHDADLRPVDMVGLVIPNLSEDEEVCRVHAGGVFTPVDIRIPRPFDLSELQIRWVGLGGNSIDFGGRHHTIEFRVFTSD